MFFFHNFALTNIRKFNFYKAVQTSRRTEHHKLHNNYNCAKYFVSLRATRPWYYWMDLCVQRVRFSRFRYGSITELFPDSVRNMPLQLQRYSIISLIQIFQHWFLVTNRFQILQFCRFFGVTTLYVCLVFPRASVLNVFVYSGS